MGDEKIYLGNFRKRVHGPDLSEIQWEDFNNPFSFFAFLTQPQRHLIEWLQRESVIADQLQCTKCPRQCRMLASSARVEKFEWRCPTKHYKASLNQHSFFQGSRFAIQDVLLFINMYLDQVPLKQISHATGFAYKTSAVQWAVFIREIFAEYFHAELSTQQLEGEVEIDESLFGRRQKYHKGKKRGMNVWVVGLVERKSTRIISYPVENRTAETLLSIITRHVKRGSVIYTDGWAGYRRLRDHGYTHYVVEHTECFQKTFPDPVTGADVNCHTNTIEGAWAKAKRHFLKMHGTKATQFESHLCEIMWRSWNHDGCRLLNFMAYVRTKIYDLRSPPKYTYPIPIFNTWSKRGQRQRPEEFDRNRVVIGRRHGSTFTHAVDNFSLVIDPEVCEPDNDPNPSCSGDEDDDVFRVQDPTNDGDSEIPPCHATLRRSLSLVHDDKCPHMPVLHVQSPIPPVMTTPYSEPPTLTPMNTMPPGTSGTQGSSDEAGPSHVCSGGPHTVSLSSKDDMPPARKKVKSKARPVTKPPPTVSVSATHDTAPGGNQGKCKPRPVTKMQLSRKIRRVSSLETDFMPVKTYLR